MLKRLCQKSFCKALWVYHANTGACNGCDIEVINVLTPYYDAERFGIKLVGSPRHADVLLVCGPVTRQVAPALKRLYDAVPAPKLVFAIGSCATGGGCWFDSYNILGGADKAIPVDIYVPGCPPRPRFRSGCSGNHRQREAARSSVATGSGVDSWRGRRTGS